MYIIKPDPFSLPCYRIGPFTTHDLSVNHSLKDSDLIDEFMYDKLNGRAFVYTENGRTAINMALQMCDLEKNDVVTILTTSGNFYVSGCVTREIEKFCNWSRQFVPETKAILINHEFGYPFKELRTFKDYQLPIIEDCAGSFFSHDKEKLIGQIGDFIIYSFPKMFPIQIGGLLVSNGRDDDSQLKNNIGEDRLRYVKNALSHHIRDYDKIINKRIDNYRFLKDQIESLGFAERFQLEPGIVPGVFMFRTEDQEINLPDLKRFVWEHGIQSSVFYGEASFFIPVHQALNEDDMRYFIKVIESFIQEIKR